jgi:glyoxylase-like metal-dependent hydrolase (beta-lactamase superfamily II)
MKVNGTQLRRGAGAMVLIGAAVIFASPRVETQGAQAKRPWPPVLSAPAPGEVEVAHVRGDIHMISGAGGNVTVQAGEEGVLLVDTGTAAMAEKTWAAVQSISKKTMRYIVNTTEQPEHAGGNAVIAPRGQIVPLRGRNYTAGPMGSIEYNKASVVAHLNVLHRMGAPTGQTATYPTVAWPDNTYSTPVKRFYFNHEAVVVTHMPGNTDGNSVVMFRNSDVISVGDLLDLSGYPLIDLKAGGSVQSLVATLNRLIEMTVPEAHAAGGTLVIAGHGRIADHAEVAYYRDMVTVVRDRIQDGIRRKLTLEQIKAARPTREFDPRYGRTTGFTTDMFVDAVYRSLTATGTN